MSYANANLWLMNDNILTTLAKFEKLHTYMNEKLHTHMNESKTSSKIGMKLLHYCATSSGNERMWNRHR
jgi:hypothetical protein